ncbi:MAG TPA: DNA polymerase III subunit gamma/tau [Candidatus Saccharimonadales bacterium]|nr:DNA polymerase III subunit gamma/tau [Candidatus Saccharimonadales bacterium]
MSSGALYRKYRSKSFEEVIGQEHITTTLVNSIKTGSFAHAYLFTGPRGVGKTSVARLFAYKVNGLEYDENETYGDIIEIDAASNRRIDEIRELREKVNIAPSALKYKVYIIDEVHMLTREAFNALLKTLEEPPEHAIFILATTDFHKVPDTIASRCIRFAFQTIPSSLISEHLNQIAKKESIKIDGAALDIIAGNSDGSFRDAISLLDQFRNSRKSIDAGYVSAILGLSPEKEIAGLVKNIESGRAKELVANLDKLRGSGANDAQITKQLIGYLRDCLIGEKKSRLAPTDISGLIRELLQTDGYSDKHLALEIALLSHTVKTAGAAPEYESADAGSNQKAPDEPEPARGSEGGTTIITNDSAGLWQSVLDNLKNDKNTLYSIARMAEAKHRDGLLELSFKFPFHYKQMKNTKNFTIIEETVKSLDDSVAEVRLTMLDDKTTGSTKPSKDSVESISNIFGPSEVLES